MVKRSSTATLSSVISAGPEDIARKGPIRDVPKVSTCRKSHPELLDVYLHYCCHGQDNHVCVYCSQNHLVAHIDSIIQLSASSWLHGARELKSRGRLHRASSPLPTYLVTTCFSVSRWVRCTSKKVNNCFSGIDPQKLLPVSWKIGGAFYPFTDTLFSLV